MNQTKTITTRTITIVALALALNYVGGTIALFLRLPIYLDTIGTIFAAVLLGPVYGIMDLSKLLLGFVQVIS
jgi:energy-coupling factor transport system substrate-specific component